LASFLQELLQVLLMARGWTSALFTFKPTVIGPYLLKQCGYKRVVENPLLSILGLPVDAFQNKTLNFITDEIQLMNGVNPSEQLIQRTASIIISGTNWKFDSAS
jgi:hypothetical protein